MWDAVDGMLKVAPRPFGIGNIAGGEKREGQNWTSHRHRTIPVERESDERLLRVHIYDAIEAHGLSAVLAHPLKLRALMVGRAKNDKNDTERLAELLRLDAVRHRTCRLKRSGSFAS